MGVLLALGPLVWVWRRNAGAGAARRLHALTVLTLFLTFDLTLFGAFTRLTDSGLGCPDWPGCYGNASPVGARHDIAMAQAAQPTGPVTHGKAWVEMVHRYLATGVGVLILVLAVATWVARRRAAPAPTTRGERALSAWWPAATLVWVCLQGAFGALTVTWKLFPAIVTLHLLGAIVLLALLCMQAVRYQQAATQRAADAAAVAAAHACWSPPPRLLALQIALGGWVSTNYAVLACTQFPTCQGSWWPPMDFAQGFQIWRAPGRDRRRRADRFRRAHRHPLRPPPDGLRRVRRHRACWPGGCVASPALARRRRAGWPAWRCCSWPRGLGNVLLGWPLAAAAAAHRRRRRAGGGADLDPVRKPSRKAPRSARRRRRPCSATWRWPR